jgi:hypothetical protein
MTSVFSFVPKFGSLIEKINCANGRDEANTLGLLL